MTPHRCGHCKRAGHYRPTCPDLATTPRARVPRRVPAAPSPAVVAAPVPVSDVSPWSLVASERDGVDFVGRFTWQHVEGERVTATVPIPPSGDRFDTTEGLVVPRRPLDPLRFIARQMPSAQVERSAAGEAMVPVRVGDFCRAATDVRSWGLW